jgi:hypothetical protein
MIDAYIVRDPQGRVIGISSLSEYTALDEAGTSRLIPPRVQHELHLKLASDGLPAEHSGYTLKKEQVAL